MVKCRPQFDWRGFRASPVAKLTTLHTRINPCSAGCLVLSFDPELQVADQDAPDEEALKAFVAERLVRYKLPRTWEITTERLRDDAGKARRTALRDARISA